MGFFDFIAKRPKTTLAIWIIITMIMAPFAMQAMNKVVYNESKLLPESAEYVKAQDYLNQIMPNATEYGVGEVLVVEGFNYTSSEAQNWYFNFKKEAIEKGYVNNTFSIYDLMNETKGGIKKNLQALYLRLYNGTKMAEMGIIALNKTLAKISSKIRALYDNVTALYNASRSLIPIYANLTKSLKKAYSQAIMLQGALLNLSKAYQNVVAQANSTYLRLLNATYEIEKGIEELDQNYTSLYHKLLLLREEMLELKGAIIGVNKMTYEVEEAYFDTYFNVLRAHYYLLKATKAYQKGITEKDVEIVEKITNLTEYGIPPVTPQLIEATYAGVLNMTEDHPELANDQLLMKLAYSLAKQGIEEKVGGVKARIMISLLQNYTKDFLSSYESWEKENGTLLGKLRYNATNPLITAESQVTLAEDLKEISKGSLVFLSKDENVAKIVQEIMGGPQKAPLKLAFLILRVSIEAGTPPNATKVEEGVLQIVSSQIPSSSPISTDVLREIYESTPTPKLALEILSKALKGEEKALSLLSLLQKYDPNATGTLLTNESAIISAVSCVLEKKVPSGFPVKSFVADVLRGELGKARELIFKIYKEGFVQSSEKVLLGFGIPREVALAMINYTLQYYEKMTPSFAYMLSAKIIASSPMISEKEAFYKALIEMKNGKSASQEALFLISQSPKMKRAGPFASLILGVLKEIGPNGSPTEAWNASIDQIMKIVPPGVNVKPLIPALNELHKMKKVGEKQFRYEAYKILAKNLKGRELVLLNYTYEYGPNLTKGKIKEILEKLITLPSFAAKGLEKLGIPPKGLIDDVITNVLGGNVSVVSKYTEIAFKHVWPNIVENMTGILIGTNGKAFLVVLNVSSVKNELKAYQLAKETLPTGHKVYIVGPNLMSYEMQEYGEKSSQRVSSLSMILVLLISIAVMGSIVAVILPFIGAGTASIMGLGTAYFLAVLGIVSLSQETNMLMLTAPLGLGVDYSVYMVYRYKLELTKGTDPKKAVVIAAKESLPGISASAFSDIIGFASLALAWDFPFMTSMGLTLPFSILYVYIASLIVVPAFLSMALDKRKAWWPFKPTIKRCGVDSKAVKKLVKAAPLVFTLTIVAGGIWGYSTFVMPTTHDWTIFLPMQGHSYAGYKAFERDFAVGEIMPTFVVIHFPHNWTKYKGMIEEMQRKIENISGVKKVYSPLNDPKLISKDGRTVAIEIYTSMNPLTSKGLQVVGKIEKIAHSYRKDGIKVYVGGTAEASRDLQAMLNRDFYHKILPILLVLIFLVLITTFQSIPISMLIIGDVFLGIFAGLAITDWVFRGIYGVELPWFLPLIIVAVMVGVGIDYNSFYINRVRELRREMSTKEAVIRAAGEFSPTIIGLSLIVSGAFASLLAGGSWGIKEMGAALTISVIVASAFATYLFLPVALYLLGDKSWWPRKKF